MFAGGTAPTNAQTPTWGGGGAGAIRHDARHQGWACGWKFRAYGTEHIGTILDDATAASIWTILHFLPALAYMTGAAFSTNNYRAPTSTLVARKNCYRLCRIATNLAW